MTWTTLSANTILFFFSKLKGIYNIHRESGTGMGMGPPHCMESQNHECLTRIPPNECQENLYTTSHSLISHACETMDRLWGEQKKRCWVWASHFMGDMDILERIQKRVMKLIRGLENTTWKERWEEFGLSSENRRWDHLWDLMQIQEKACFKEKVTSCVLDSHGDRTSTTVLGLNSN